MTIAMPSATEDLLIAQGDRLQMSLISDLKVSTNANFNMTQNSTPTCLKIRLKDDSEPDSNTTHTRSLGLKDDTKSD